MDTLTVRDPEMVYGVTPREFADDPVIGGSLSPTDVSNLLKAPAIYYDHISNPADTTTPDREDDVNELLHALLLDKPLDVQVIYHDSYRTKAARAERDLARKSGVLPVLEVDVVKVEAILDNAFSNPNIGKMLLGEGEVDVGLFSPDPRTGVWFRSLVDKMIKDESGKVTLIKLVTGIDSDPVAFSQLVAKRKYYLDSYISRNLYKWLVDEKADVQYVFVAVGKDSPNLTSINMLTPEYDGVARREVDRAVVAYQDSLKSGMWEGYGGEVHMVTPPDLLLENTENPDD